MGQKEERMFNIIKYVEKNTTFTGSKKNYMNVFDELAFFSLGFSTCNHLFLEL